MDLIKVDLDTPEIDGIEIAHGLAPVLNTITEIINKNIRYNWSLFLVNFETLIRNRMSEKDYITPIVDGALNDGRILANYLIALSEHCQKVVEPIVAFYIPNYKTIHSRYLRPILPAHTEERWQYVEELKKRLSQEWDIKSETTHVLLVEQDDHSRSWLSKDLIKDIDSAKYHPAAYRDTLMLSHMPVDYHLMRRVKTWNLIESYTGAIKKASEMSQKIYNTPYLPFNKYTHVLFGDKYLLKAIAAPKVRKEIKERAQREHWERFSEPAILKLLQDMRFVPTQLLTSPDV